MGSRSRVATPTARPHRTTTRALASSSSAADRQRFETAISLAIAAHSAAARDTSSLLVEHSPTAALRTMLVAPSAARSTRTMSRATSNAAFSLAIPQRVQVRSKVTDPRQRRSPTACSAETLRPAQTVVAQCGSEQAAPARFATPPSSRIPQPVSLVASSIRAARLRL